MLGVGQDPTAKGEEACTYHDKSENYGLLIRSPYLGIGKGKREREGNETSATGIKEKTKMMIKISDNLERLLLCFVMFLSMGACTQSPSSTSGSMSQLSSPSPEVETHEIVFEPLSSGEGLEYKIDVIGTKPNRMSLTAYAVGTKKRQLLALMGSSINDRPLTLVRDQIDSKIQWITVQIGTEKGPDSLDAIEIWFIDGRNGTARKLLSSTAFAFMVDNNGKIICVFDFYESFEVENVPTFTLYEIETMQKIKTVQYKPFRGVNISPVKMTFADNVFSVTLANDGPDSAVVSIPID